MEVVRKIQAVAALKSTSIPSSSTAAYCKARQKFKSSELENIFSHTSFRSQQEIESSQFNNRRVVVVDGTGVSMPDTPENQTTWPQQKKSNSGLRISTSENLCMFLFTHRHFIKLQTWE